MPSSRSGAGEKFATYRRRQRLAITPYDRRPPHLTSSLRRKSPNWFTAVVVPSARAIASGAGKILSSIFSESDSSSSDDEDCASEDDVNTGNDGVGKSEKESLLTMQRAGTKKLIEQLIMLETFSREECDKLIQALNSRVTDCPREEGGKSLLAGFPENLTDHDADIYDRAVEETNKWFQEKKVGSSKATEFVHGSPTLTFNGLEQVDSGGGSPVDVAKSYMKDRPPWPSPTNFELRTTLTTKNLFNEGTLHSVGPDSFSSLKKRNFLASGSWNMQEELRRVRSKAADDLLRTPSSKVDPALLSAAQSWRESVGAAKVISTMGEQLTQPESFRKTEAVDQMIGAGGNYGPTSVVLGTRQDGKAGEAHSSRPAISIDGNNENLEAVLYDGEFAASESLEEHHTALYWLPETRRRDEKSYKENNDVEMVARLKQERELKRLETSVNYNARKNPHLNKTNGPPPTEEAESVMKPDMNGLPLSEASFPGVAIISGSHDEQHENHDAEQHEMGNHNAAEGDCEHLEAFMEVPVVAETESVTSGSQNSLTIHNQESPRNLSQPSPKAKATGQQQLRRSERYNQKKPRKR